MRIDRCQCYGRTFAELKMVAAATGADSIVELQRHVRFGMNCRLCHPYVRRMLKTGETVFREIVSDGVDSSIREDE